tara:strand:- start:262908 stop:263453 length:546 start_codon:yes stop_codon:yes gene_type:complete
MNKAFVKEGTEESLSSLPEMPIGVRNYITPHGYRSLQDELQRLHDASHSELRRADVADEDDATSQQPAEDLEQNVREREQRIQYLNTRLETAEIVDPSVHHGNDQIFFGASVEYQNLANERHTVTIVGLDELDPSNGKISWLSPMAKALLKANEGDTVVLDSPAGNEKLRILNVRYPRAST